MKISRMFTCRSLVTAIMVFGIGIAFMPNVQAQPLTVGFNETDAKPYKWRDQTGQYTGALMEMMKEVARKSGLEITFMPLPMKRVLLAVETGEIAGAFAIHKTEDREQYAVYLETPLSWASYKIFVKKGHEFAFTSANDLKGKTVGIIRGQALGDDFQKTLENGVFKISEVSSYDQNVEKLMAERIDAIAGPAQSLQALIREMKLSAEIVMLPNPIGESNALYVILSKKANLSPELVEKINSTLKSMAANGEFATFTQKYGYEYKP
jgi:polar amino acid transport system substrate-binding protein